MNIDGLIGHIRTVVDHKKWVWYYCSRLGMYKAGLLHDLSKFSPTELLESAEYYAGGTSSPINEAKTRGIHWRGSITKEGTATIMSIGLTILILVARKLRCPKNMQMS